MRTSAARNNLDHGACPKSGLFGNARIRAALIVFATVLAVLASLPMTQAVNVTGIAITAPLQTTGETETWTFTFTFHTAIPAGGDVLITFPAGFVVSNGAATVCATASVADETTTNTPPTVTECNFPTGLAAGAHTLTFTNVRNPTTVGAAYNIVITTRNAVPANVETGNANVAITAHAFTAGPTQASPDLQAGAINTHTFTFTGFNTWANNGVFEATFPAGYTFSQGGASVAAFTAPGGAGTFGAVVVAGQQLSFTRAADGGAIAGGTAVTITVTNIRNPVVAGATGAFTVATADNAGADHDSGAPVGVAIVAHVFTAGPTQASPDLEASAVNTHTFTFTPFNDWEANGNLEITFPAGYTFNAGGAGTTTAAFTVGGSGTFAAPGIAGQTLTFLRQGGAVIAGGTAVTLTVTQIRNPANAGATGVFVVTTSNNAGADHDLGNAAGVQITGGLASSVGTGTVHVLDFGQANDLSEDCVYFDGQAPAAAVAPTNFDVRLTPCRGKAAGTLVGDADTVEKNYAVGAGNTAPAVTIKYADVNNNGRYDKGDYVYSGTGAATVLQASQSPAQFTVRLTAAGAKAAGTFVYGGEADFTSYSTTVRALTMSLAWLDEDLSVGGELTEGDDAYLVPRAAGWASNVLFPIGSLRLSMGNANGAYGSQVEAAHADLLPQTNVGDAPDAAPTGGDLGLGGANVRAVPGTLRVASTGIYVDADGSITVTAGDTRHVSYVPGLVAAAVAAGDVDIGVALRTPDANFPVPVYADTNADGVLALGENLYRVAAGGVGAALGANDRRHVSLARVLHLDLGSPGDVRDNCAYLDADDNNAVSTNDVRLAPCAGKAVGSLVGDADTTERGVAATAPAMKLVRADVNSNGRWDAADYLYLTTTVGAGAALTGSTSATAHTLRLTPAGSFAAGTWVFSSDADFRDHGANTVVFAGGYAYFDADMSGGFTMGDRGYVHLAGQFSVVHKLISLHAVRLTTDNAAGAYGTKVVQQDGDFLETLGTASIVFSPIHVLDFDQANDVRDDCVYLEVQGAAGAAAVAPTNYDVRLVPCQGKAYGSLVVDGDTTEKTFAVGARNTNPAVTMKFADVNNNGRYDLNDYVYLGTGAGNVMQASAGPAQFTIRMTAVGTKAAGSFVFAADSDFVSYSGSIAALAGSIAWFDADRSANGEFTPGDSAYWLPRNAPGYAAGNLFPLGKIRLTEGPPVSPPTTTPTTTPTTSPTTTSPITTPATTSPTGSPTGPTTQPTTTPAATSATKKTPGLGLASLMVGLAVAALVAARRRA